MAEQRPLQGYGTWCYWSGGHAVSNYVSGDFSTYGNSNSQLTVYKKGVSGLERTGGGHNGSDNFAVHFGYADNSGYGLGEDALPTLTFADGNMYVIDHMYVNNICYAINCYIDGNGLTAKIGPDDWVKLIATGYNTNGTKTGEASFYLCNGPDNIVTDWTKWDLTSLGKVAKVTFNVTGSSDNGYGFSQPAYFAYDDVAVQVGDGWPEPETAPVTVKVDGKEQYLEKLTGGSDTFAEEYYALSVPYGTSLTISMPKAPMIIVEEIREDRLFDGDEGENSFVATENVLKSCLIDDGNLEAIGVKGFKPKAGNKAAFLRIMDATVCKPYGLLIELECVPAAFVKLDKTELYLVEGDNATLTATVLPDNTTDKTVTWTTSDPEIATVENGAVTAVKAGKATITATCGSVKNTCAVTVRADLPEPKKDEDGTYLIDSVDALRWFSDNVNAGQSALNAKLTADIDLTGYDWTPIGESSSKYFAGNFDGQGHTITLKVEHTAATSGALNRGIFGTVKGTSSARPAIKNLTVTGEMNLSAGAYTSTANAAAIVGSATYADLTNLHADVDITLVKKNGNCSAIAGVVGNISSTTVTNCSNSGNISGCDSVGGVVGKASGTGTAITGCYNTGNISASSNYAGGILSQLTSVVTIANCYNAGKVETTGMYAGGIVSYVSNASATVSNCFGFGEVNPPKNSNYGHGSVIGSLTNAGTVLTNLYYLEGSCTSGVGLNKSETQTATAKTAAEFVSADFVTAMNTGLAEAAYKANTGCGNYPILAWQTTPEHNYVDGVCTVCGKANPDAPYLLDGVTDTAAIVQTGKSYQLDDLMDGKIFGVAEGNLTYKNYFYTMSSDGGESWSAEAGFEKALFGGVNKSLVQNTAGDYLYKFYARNEAGTSAKTWTLTLHVRDSVTANVSFYVGQDQNYKTNGNVYPKLELYKTAGIDENQFDYVGWFTNADGKTEYVYNPADYTIIEGETNYVEVNGTKYELHDYEKIAFTNSAFDAADETATASNTVVNNYNMFYATLSTGRYSTRGYGWNTETEAYDIYLGGQSMPLPIEKDIYGNGGNDIYLGIVSVYTTTKNEKNEPFGVDDYYVEMIMPVTGSMIHAGAPYAYSTWQGNCTAFPFLSWEAQNASLYNIYAYPKDTEKYMFNQAINQTTKATYNVTTKSISISGAVVLTVNAPTDAEFGLYFQYNNFNTKPVEPFETAVNAESGMTTYRYRVSKSNPNYTWRLSDPNETYVTKAGWLASLTAATEKTITFADGAPTDKKTHDFSKLGTQVITRDEADLQVFLSHSGFQSVSDTYRVRAYRMWELIDGDASNIMIEPSFNVQVLQGNAADVRQVSGGNAVGNWLDVTPTGTDIVAVNYDAIDLSSSKDVVGTHGGLFPATAPERTGVFVITNEAAGKADAVIRFNGGTTSNRGAEWDYNYDTWYYLDTDEAPMLDFTTTKGATASYAVVTTDAALNSTLSGWTELTADENGTFHASLLPFRTAKTLGGTVILKLTDSTGTSYRLARVAQMSVTVKNASNDGEPIMPGDQVTLSFDGLYRTVNKVAGIFNPTNYYLRYSSDKKEFNGTLAQYQQMDRASITVTLPTDIAFPEGADKTTYTISNGYIYGGMYSASSPFDTLYNMTDTGVGTNFSAASISFVLSRLADIPVEVNTKAYYNVKLAPVDESGNALSGLTVTLTDRNGSVLTAEADGTFKLGFGPYTYTVEQLGNVRTSGSFTLGSADAAKVEDGVLTIKITVRKAAANAWDGKTVTEPATDENGVYLIGTGAELAWFAQKVNGGSTKISGILTADIDLAGYEWTPIGTSSKNFAGSFDGRNHTIDNLSIDYHGTTAVSPYKGLFGWVNGTANARAKIMNLTVNGDVKLTSTKYGSNPAYCAGIAGRADYADLTNLHANVDVTVNRQAGNWEYVGGVVGGSYYSLNVTNCSNSGNITGWRYCAGVVGGFVSGYQPGTITGCVNTGNILAPSTCAAGIVSNLAQNCKVTACYNTGAIKAGGNYPAGIAGNANKGSVVANCFNLGTVTCNETFVYGSVVGTVSDATAVIKNLYYLEGTCDKGGIGSVKDEATQTATAKTAEEIASADFIAAMNADLDEAAFMAGCVGVSHPILVWEGETAHTFTNTTSGVLAKEATCTEAALYYIKCDVCGAVSTHTVPVGAALGHKYEDVVTPATCTEAGYTTHTCSVCGDSYVDAIVKATGHQYENVVTAPTCTEAGYTTHTCSVCKDTFVDSIVKATGHQYEDVVTAPTCTEAGYTTHTCSVCQFAYVDSVVKATGHDYASKVVDATCDAMGYTEYTCKTCGDSYRTNYTPATEHNYTAEVTTAPTCTAEGVKTFTCADCGKTYTEPVAKIAHDYRATVTAPTCTTMGYTTYTCAVCNDSYRADYVDATGHDCETVVTPATCLAYGYTTNTCKTCGYAYLSAITEPTGHTEAIDAAVAPTCTETGLTEGKHCSVCNEVLVKQEVVAATGHTFENGKCTVCGAEDPDYVPEWVNPFKDVAENDWFYDGVKFVHQNGLFNGTSADTFSPNAPMTRGMLVTVLWRLDGKTAPAAAASFADVDAKAYYADAVAWAAENGVVNGVDATHFAPENEVTREQIAAILYRYAEKKGADTTKRAALSTFPDANKVSSYAKDAMAWAVEANLITGIKAANETTLSPQTPAPRAQVAAILSRYCESI